MAKTRMKHRILPEMTSRARRLRHDATFPERLLWGHLRGRRFGAFKFRRQHVLGPYVADFFCAECQLIIELDGHSHDTTATGDVRREEFLRRMGIEVIRFTNDEVLGGIERVLTAIENTLVLRHAALSNPHPYPSPCKGEGFSDAPKGEALPGRAAPSRRRNSEPPAER
ncbi:MAG TPA: DUF559 domain-containing protein [Phycisphaerae bacterium]|nr:DUF559 domain-containing protein [Phycisphaerae bacterium]HNU46522.1 DUF559 domain-containing protein [Phycisphaerae bacterium]